MALFGGSKSSTSTNSDSSAVGAEGGSVAWRAGDNATVSMLDGGAITGALSFTSDATKALLDTIDNFASNAMNFSGSGLSIGKDLAASGISAAVKSSEAIGDKLAAAYRDERGNVNWTTVLTVLAIAAALGVVAYVTVKK